MHALLGKSSFKFFCHFHLLPPFNFKPSTRNTNIIVALCDADLVATCRLVPAILLSPYFQPLVACLWYLLHTKLMSKQVNVLHDVCTIVHTQHLYQLCFLFRLSFLLSTRRQSEFLSCITVKPLQGGHLGDLVKCPV